MELLESLDDLPTTANLNSDVESINLLRILDKKKTSDTVLYLTFNTKEAFAVL